MGLTMPIIGDIQNSQASLRMPHKLFLTEVGHPRRLPMYCKT